MGYGNLTYIALGVAALLVGADQLIKFFVSSYFVTVTESGTKLIKDSVPFIPNILHWSYLENEGAAFGIFPGQKWLLIGLTTVVILGCIYLLAAKKIKSPFLIWSLSLVIAGGLGNLIDRIFRHYVIDYIEVRFVHFAIFNFADCCVVVGTILIICYLLFGDFVKERHLKKAEENGETVEQMETEQEGQE